MATHAVVGADDSPSSRAAVEWAADDAMRRGCALRIVHVCEDLGYDIPLQTPPGFRDSVSEYCQGVLDAAADLVRDRAPGLEVEISLETGRVVEVLRREAEDAEQLVVGGRGRGGFTGLLLGSVPLRLAGHVPVPVVVVKGALEQEHGEVVVGVEGSAHSAVVLRYAFEEAARREARLHAVYAWEMPVLGPYAPVYTPLVEEISVTGKRVVEEALASWQEKYPQVEVEKTAICEHPVVALRDASESADLVVVGSRGLGALSAAVLGSVSHGVLHHARCPVAVVPTRGKA
ncbi:universal stress protein [Streptosporangium sp. NPDC000396]|uniref:universal stress protein n=1 Tax=Streptosporangium sp. NPDC000396 TaxID=3366185 RepID=UPI0036BD5ECD